MGFVIKIALTVVVATAALLSKGQNETNLLPFSNLVLVNPSFAGLDKNTSFNTGNQYYGITDNKMYNQFFTTYDTYSEKLKGGVGIVFRKGLIGELNTGTTEMGFTYAGFPMKLENGKIITSFATNLVMATKQWYAFSMDEIVNRNAAAIPPGEDFFRYYLLKPRLGLLADMNTFRLGLSGAVPFRFNIAGDDAESTEETTGLAYGVSFYFSKKIDGLQYGLESRPFDAYPELIAFYGKEFFLSRLSFVTEHIDKTIGLFVQNDFTHNIHSAGGTFGLRKKNLRINLSSGIGIPGLSEHVAFTGELSLKLVVPPVYYSKINPFAPKRKSR